MAEKKAPAASRQLEEKSFGHFLPKKERLRQAASWRKMFFSQRNAILGKKKAPAATRQRRKMVKNIKIGLKRVAVGAFGTSPGPKCTEKQDLQPRNGDIAPKPLK